MPQRAKGLSAVRGPKTASDRCIRGRSVMPGTATIPWRCGTKADDALCEGCPERRSTSIGLKGKADTDSNSALPSGESIARSERLGQQFTPANSAILLQEPWAGQHPSRTYEGGWVHVMRGWCPRGLKPCCARFAPLGTTRAGFAKHQSGSAQLTLQNLARLNWSRLRAGRTSPRRGRARARAQ